MALCRLWPHNIERPGIERLRSLRGAHYGKGVTMLATDTGGRLREAIRKSLARRTKNARDPGAIAEAAVSTWQEVAAQLSPIIGARGVDVLFGRALHLTSMTSTSLGLAVARKHEEGATILADFKRSLQGRDAVAATEAGLAFFFTFTELLGTLIGESLTERLLSSVWASQPTSPEQERKA